MKKDWQAQLPLDQISDISPVSGGDVNEAFKVTTKDDVYFLLVQRNRDKSFYAAEIAGLNAFEQAGITAPRVIDSGEINGDAFLILSYLDEGTSGSQRELGQLVAKMHSQQQQDGQFGFDLPHEGGDISFDNSWSESWVEIFVERRMDHLRDELMRKGLWHAEDNKVYEQVRTVMVNELEDHHSKPSLLHGDLWGGNYMFLTDGRPALFDPAPFYGDREFDLGITMVFGGFTQAFYDEYEKHYPLRKGARKRLEFYRLYLFMVHLLKFGGMYASSVNRSMDEILA
ncbi:MULTISPECIES: fructosamine kinase family protein [unclassified Staphylococcus]|uniref:fructosamine kinase family protein n=1 Tax=unclassified Staphylococcus TaxID=91994 RepID=UPI001880D0B6|nr:MULTISPECIES: fructosamine kinase family protein [unclassified Staphylococcus]MBF2758096.1 fructosamine kinase family protein [Staphylococcus haemolyticus]MBF2773892.1 fructosamine kinase family protein [Staphylococcus haemolyticus]MBF2776471.1 fructosamine kinase family protein [Staphylococcus haemolyticus]MBF2815945.1 fructosamine kinase family protein [Staphylococcus haemolyticus]MBF9719335.1 fructosamine kinase family protein [Staphylococcus haemolyticus]